LEAKAVHRFARISPHKTRPVARLVQGAGVNEALSVLEFTPNRAAKVITKVLKSAIANAGYDVDPDDLWVLDARVDEGPTRVWWRAGTRGMAFPIRRRTCHIRVVVTDAPRVEAERQREG
jgi:large subunit ribosomal protein L22